MNADIRARLSAALARSCKRQPYEEPRVSIFESDLRALLAEAPRPADDDRSAAGRAS